MSTGDQKPPGREATDELASARRVLETYGGDPERWPDAERSRTERALLAHPELARIQHAETELDDLLSRDGAPAASEALRARVMESFRAENETAAHGENPSPAFGGAVEGPGPVRSLIDWVRDQIGGQTGGMRLKPIAISGVVLILGATSGVAASAAIERADGAPEAQLVALIDGTYDVYDPYQSMGSINEEAP